MTVSYYNTQLYNGIASSAMLKNLGMSVIGCPYRGTTTCHRCPWEPVAECSYLCDRCEHGAYCKCGHDQTVRLRAWGVVG